MELFIARQLKFAQPTSQKHVRNVEKITSTDHDYEQQKEQKGGRGGGGVKIQANHKHDPQNA